MEIPIDDIVPSQLKRKDRTVGRTCPQCGNDFRVRLCYLKGPNRALYCCRACRTEARRASACERAWQRLQARLERRGNCLVWTGPVDKDGYGEIYDGTKRIRVHHLAWVRVNGPVPEGILLRHVVCDNPPCCEESHLAPGTQADNIADRHQKGRDARGDRHGSKTHPERIPRGPTSPAAKFSASEVRAIRAEYDAGGITKAELSRKYGMSDTSMGRLVMRQTYAEVA
jgi:hypothetical protein